MDTCEEEWEELSGGGEGAREGVREGEEPGEDWVCRIVGRRDMVKAEGGGEMDQPIGSGWYVKEPRAA
jgi:hypothetical protein